MNFDVPQYIEIEDKIVGPLTIQQAIYIGGGLGACFLLYKFLPSFIALPLMFGAAGLALAFAFYKVNNRPFIQVFQSAILYYLSNKLYVWKREDQKKRLEVKKRDLFVTPTTLVNPKMTEGKLKDIAWSLDINQKIR